MWTKPLTYQMRCQRTGASPAFPRERETSARTSPCVSASARDPHHAERDIALDQDEALVAEPDRLETFATSDLHDDRTGRTGAQLAQIVVVVPKHAVRELPVSGGEPVGFRRMEFGFQRLE